MLLIAQPCLQWILISITSIIMTRLPGFLLVLVSTIATKQQTEALKKRKINFVSVLKGREGMMSRALLSTVAEACVITHPHLGKSGIRENELKLGFGCNSQRLTPSDPHLPARHPSTHTQPPKTALSAKDQTFKHMGGGGDTSELKYDVALGKQFD